MHAPCTRLCTHRAKQVSSAEVACLASHAAAWREAERSGLDWNDKEAVLESTRLSA